jgi:hypothetical protein
MDKGNIQSLCDDLLDQFMAALNAHNSAAMDACMHFPWGIQARSSFGP